MAPCIALLTDFGLDDPYVGQVKAVLLSRVPGLDLIDLSHGLRPQDVLQAAFFLDASLPHLPGGSLCLCVVDPGVGTQRRVVLIEHRGRRILAPDNGLPTLLLNRGDDLSAWDLTPGGTQPAAATFHGRDVFAPLAAALVLGENPASLGAQMEPGALIRLELPAASLRGRVLRAQVIHVDRFGNCILNLPAHWCDRLRSVTAWRLEQPVSGTVLPVRTYADLEPGALGLVMGSQGYFELAMQARSAARELDLSPGAQCLLRAMPPDTPPFAYQESSS